MSKIEIKTKGLEDLVDKLEQTKNGADEFIEYATKQLAIELLRRTMNETPEDTSNLVRRWTDHETSLDGEAKNVTREEWAEKEKIDKKGKKYALTIYNPTEYAPYVEYGHRILDEFGNQIGKVDGFNMLKNGVLAVDKMKDGLIEKYLKKYLQEIF